MLYFIYMILFLSIVLVVFGIYKALFSTRDIVAYRLEYYTAGLDSFDEEISFKEALLNAIGFLGKTVSRKNYMDRKQKNLNQAYISMRVEEFIGISLLLSIFSSFVIYISSKQIPVALIGLILGFVIPDIFVTMRRKKRIKQLSNQLPEALAILSNGLRAGFSFTQAMTVASNELESPIKDEFAKIVRDNSFGMSIDEALQNFSKRTDDEDVDMLVTALVIQRKVGGNLAEILDTISATIRDRMRIRGEVETLTAQGRLSAMIISLLPFGIAGIIFIINPEYIMQLFSNTFGVVLVVSAIFMQLIGMYLIMNMANIEI